MQFRGQFVCLLYERETDKYHPEGEWQVLGADGRLVAENTPPSTRPEGGPFRLRFWSHTGKTGGDLVGCFAAPNVFRGEGIVWGPVDIASPSGYVAVYTANVAAYNGGPVEYVGSLRQWGVKSPQQAILARQVVHGIVQRLLKEAHAAGLPLDQIAALPSIAKTLGHTDPGTVQYWVEAPEWRWD